MKSRSEIWEGALMDFGALCSVDTQRDAETMRRRAAAEGDSFFTVTLPEFGKQFEYCLDAQCIAPVNFRGWARQPVRIKQIMRSSDRVTAQEALPVGPPKFLGGFFDLLFSWCDTLCTTDPREFDWIVEGMREDPDYGALSLWPTLFLKSGDEEWTYNGGPEFHVMANAVAAIRQLTLMFGKEKNDAPDKAKHQALQAYEATDQELDSPLL